MFRNFFHSRFIQPELDKLEQKILGLSSIVETDETFGRNYGKNFRTRFEYERKDIIVEALKLWRVNPLARRIVELTTSFVIGKGISFTAKDSAKKELLAFWGHHLNKLDEQIPQWSNELSITGDLFLLCTLDKEKNLFIRPVPSEQIKEIATKQNDVAQEIKYIYGIDKNKEFYPAYEKGEQSLFMLHYAINKPAAASFGESDFTPIISWLNTYSKWLENRALLNRYRTAFMYVLRGKFKGATERLEREREIRKNPPSSGSVLVTDESESWGILSANLDSFDANVDGLAIKKMIAAGAGFPLHFLSEPESGTRTTAVAAGTPTFRKLSARQIVIKQIITNVLTIAASLKENGDAEIIVRMDDITQRDNAATALAIARSVPSLGDLFDREIIESDEFIRLVYRLAGEDLPESIGTGKRRPLTKQVETQKIEDIESDETLPKEDKE